MVGVALWPLYVHVHKHLHTKLIFKKTSEDFLKFQQFPIQIFIETEY